MVISSFRYTGANIDTFVDQNKDLKFDSESDRKPVEPSQVWFDVVSPLHSLDQPRCRILLQDV